MTSAEAWGIKKGMANNLSNGFVSGNRLAPRAARFAGQSPGALFVKRVSQLSIAFSRVAIFLRGFGDAQPFALPFNKHQELDRDFVIARNDQRAAGSPQRSLLSIPFHRRTSVKPGVRRRRSQPSRRRTETPNQFWREISAETVYKQPLDTNFPQKTIAHTGIHPVNRRQN